jgi:phosphoglycerate dehydrogenase-like enzyme
MARVLYIGAPEATAAEFVEMVGASLPLSGMAAVDGREAALAHVDDCEVMIGHHFQFDEELVSRAPRLKWIQSLTTGTDQILKLKSLPADAVVTSTRGMHGPQMSELVFLHMLALARDFPRILGNQAAGRWERWPQPLLWGKTVVVVGLGAIAEALAPRCKAFGMSVHGVTGTPRPVPGFDLVHPRDELAEVAALADFMVLIVPLSPETENLINDRVLRAMKPEAYLVNAARGGVLDEPALLAALREGRIAGAGLDVFRQQPLPPDSPWWREPRVIVTPLLGGMSDIYLQQAFPVIAANLRRFLEGRLDAMHNVVPRWRKEFEWLQ